MGLSAVHRNNSFAVAPDGVLCQSRDPNNWAGGRTTIGVVRSKAYWECKITDDGLCRIGVTASGGSLNIGTDARSFGFGGTGKKSHGMQFADYGETFTKNDVMGVFLDLDTYTISFAKNGTASIP